VISPLLATSRTFGDRSFWTGSQDDADRSPRQTRGVAMGTKSKAKGKKHKNKSVAHKLKKKLPKKVRKKLPI